MERDIAHLCRSPQLSHHDKNLLLHWLRHNTAEIYNSTYPPPSPRSQPLRCLRALAEGPREWISLQINHSHSVVSEQSEVSEECVSQLLPLWKPKGCSSCLKTGWHNSTRQPLKHYCPSVGVVSSFWELFRWDLSCHEQYVLWICFDPVRLYVLTCSRYQTAATHYSALNRTIRWPIHFSLL